MLEKTAIVAIVGVGGTSGLLSFLQAVAPGHWLDQALNSQSALVVVLVVAVGALWAALRKKDAKVEAMLEKLTEATIALETTVNKVGEATTAMTSTAIQMQTSAKKESDMAEQLVRAVQFCQQQTSLREISRKGD